MVTLYSNDCPKCKLLKNRLDAMGIEYETSQDFKSLFNEGFRSAPILQLEDGTKLRFEDAIKYLQKRGQ